MLADRNPLYFIQNGLQLGLQGLQHYGPVAMRLPGVLFAGLVIFCFYKVIANWYTRRIALFGVITLASSSWLLHSTRIAGHDAVYLLLFALFGASVWLQRSPASRYAPAGCAAICAILLYIPGMIWFVVPLLIWQRRRIRNVVATFATWQLVILALLVFLVAAPLLWLGARNPGFAIAWLGLPGHWPRLGEIVRGIADIPIQLFWRGPDNPVAWLGRLPLLDYFQSVMFVVGLYAYYFKLKLDRTWFLIYVFAAGSILVAFGGPVSITLLLPFIYLVIASGIALMLQQWFTVFPRNPFARTVGITLLSAVLFISCLYQLNHYFVAWPRTPETKAVFQYSP